MNGIENLHIKFYSNSNLCTEKKKKYFNER